jgi:hypothetical protein
VSGQAGEDSGYLGWRFAWGEDYLGHALTQGAMVIELGETQVFEGHVAEAFHGLVGRELALPNLIEQFLKRLGVHR